LLLKTGFYGTQGESFLGAPFHTPTTSDTAIPINPGNFIHKDSPGGASIQANTTPYALSCIHNGYKFQRRMSLLNFPDARAWVSKTSFFSASLSYQGLNVIFDQSFLRPALNRTRSESWGTFHPPF
jgi:hypothetical protein